MTVWLCRVISPPLLIAALITGWAPFLILGAIWWSIVGEPPDQEVRDVGILSLFFVAAVYGFYRVIGFHPALRSGYRDWLARTPWTPAKPLPDGPVLLAGQDLFVLAVLGVPAALVFGSAMWPLVLRFAFTYLLSLAILLRMTRERAFAYLVWCGLAGMILTAHIPAAVASLAVTTYVLAAIGFRRSLEEFPWLPDEDEKARARAVEANRLGWPFDRLKPLAAPPVLRPWEAPVIGLLVGFSLLAIGFQLDRYGPNAHGERPSEIVKVVLLVVVVGALWRNAQYLSGHLPPISLAGRFGTGRLIIPKYDAVFIAPLLAVAVMVAAIPVFAASGLPEYAGVAVGSGLAVVILLSAGPDRSRWQLTAPVRLVPLGKQPLRRPSSALGTLPRQ